jgi:hypothetical protein
MRKRRASRCTHGNRLSISSRKIWIASSVAVSIVFERSKLSNRLYTAR